jgi:translocation and assembly module TamB
VADVQAKAHLWTDGDDQAQALQLEPVVGNRKGPPLWGGGELQLLASALFLAGADCPCSTDDEGGFRGQGSYDLRVSRH